MEKKPKKEGNSERWLLTYSDLITLLLALFILLFAMSNVDKAKYTQLAQSANEAMGNSSDNFQVLDNGSGILDNSGSNTPGEQETTTTSGEQESGTQSSGAEDLKSDIENALTENGLNDGVQTTVNGKIITICLSKEAYFLSGSADLSDYMKNVLTVLSGQLIQIKSTIVVRGYTDNVPTDGILYATNWQLSAMRAANVVQYMIDDCSINSERLIAVGCGENYPKVSNDTEEGRTQNRRIELAVTYDE